MEIRLPEGVEREPMEGTDRNLNGSYSGRGSSKGIWVVTRH